MAVSDRVRWAWMMTAAAGLCIGLPTASAQTTTVLPTAERFATERLRAQTVSGGIELRADLATVWTEQIAGRTVQRVLLEGAVRLRLGNEVFESERAVLWIRRIEGEQASQVFAYLEDVGARTSAPGLVAEELSVGGVVAGEIKLVTEVVQRGAPSQRAQAQQVELLNAAAGSLDEYYNPPEVAPTQRRAFSDSGRTPVPLPELPEPVLPEVVVAQGDAEAEGDAPEVGDTTPTGRTAPPPVGRQAQVRPDPRPADEPRREVRQPVPPAGEAVVQRDAAAPAAPGTPVAPQSPGAPGAPVKPMEQRTAGISSEAMRSEQPWRPPLIAPQPVPEARLRDGVRTERSAPVQPTAVGQDVGRVLIANRESGGSSGLLTFSAEDIAIVAGEGEGAERTILLSGGVALELSNVRDRQGLVMTAQRAVIFLTPGTLGELGRIDRADVLGVYLEGEASLQDDRYTQRGSRLYYDVQADRALVLDAVLSTFEPRLGTPLYVRAESIRREGERQFVAERATIGNTSFAKPFFTVGARQVVVERYQRQVGEDIQTGNVVDAKGVNMKTGPLPVFWWPRWVGDPERIPLRGIGFESSNTEGFAFKTAWDAWVLAGLEPPEGVRTEVLIDAYEKRGVGLGGLVSWGRPTFDGSVFGYLLPNDNGVDDLRTGEEFDQDGRLRGMIVGENRWDIDESWTLRLEGAHISDQRFLESVFDEEFRNRREFTTRGVLSRRGERTLFEAELGSNVDDFISNEYLLLSQGYSVDRLPEIRFTQLTSDPLADYAPGLITYNAEVRAGQLGLNFDDVLARERGFGSNFLAQEAFGINADQSIGDRLRMEGLNEKPIWRFDTRHEFAMPLKLGEDGAINLTPFVVGRVTSYDSSFSGFSPEEEDKNRLWGAAGVRLSTTISGVDESVESRTLDLHRLRHVIEPGITVWHSGTTIDQEDLPVYDDEVESLVEGTMVRMGVDQRWQTQRGGPGRWRSVDVFTLRAEWVWSGDDVEEQSPIGRYVEERPELSNPGEFYNFEALWQVSEAVGLAGRLVHDIDNRESSYMTAGVIIDHGIDFQTSFDVRRVEAIDSTVLGANASYQVTPKYRVFTNATYDTVEEDLENLSAGLEREFPNLTLRSIIRYNNIRDETSFGFAITPAGGSGGGFGFAGIGGTDNRSVAR